MTRPAKQIVNAAIKLAESDRLQIVEELLASLEPDTENDVDAAWAAEVQRRSREIKEGIVPGRKSKRRPENEFVAAAKVVFHPGASEDYAAAFAWYYARQSARFQL